MQELLKQFAHAAIRDYKGGKEIRTKNLDESLIKARRTIQENNLDVEIFEVDSRLRSFAIRKKTS